MRKEDAVRVALAQMRCRLGSVVENCRKVSRLSARAADKKCDVVIFPETADTGFEASVIRQHASDAGGEPFHTIAHGAKANGIYVLCGVTERKDGNIYNSLVAFGPEGRLLSIYRKIHLITPPPFNEGLCFSAGDTPVVLEIDGMRWGLSICYDLRFPELYRRLALDGAEILVVCAAWPSFRLMHWDLLTRARAIENQAYLLAVDRVGTDGEITFAGKSRIVSPFGEVLAEGGTDIEELVIAEIDSSAIRSFRESVPAFAARRADVYGDLRGPKASAIS